MSDATIPTDAAQSAICPWCSAAIRADSATCPSCGAILISDDVSELPGVTEIDPKVARGEKPPPPRNRLLSWISGEYPDEAPSANEAQALAPPDPEVQREIIRLELEAEVANLEAERDSLLSEAVVEGRLEELPQEIQPLATGEFDADALAAATTDEDGVPVPAAEASAADTTTTPAEAPAADAPASDDEAPPA